MPDTGFKIPAVATYAIWLTLVLYCVLNASNASNINCPLIRSVTGSSRVKRASTLYWGPVSRLFTGSNGTRDHPPDPFRELAYAMGTAVNCCPFTITRGVSGSEEPSVARPEICPPLIKSRAVHDPLLATTGCQVHNIVTRFA